MNHRKQNRKTHSSSFHCSAMVTLTFCRTIMCSSDAMFSNSAPHPVSSFSSTLVPEIISWPFHHSLIILTIYISGCFDLHFKCLNIKKNFPFQSTNPIILTNDVKEWLRFWPMSLQVSDQTLSKTLNVQHLHRGDVYTAYGTSLSCQV